MKVYVNFDTFKKIVLASEADSGNNTLFFTRKNDILKMAIVKHNVEYYCSIFLFRIDLSDLEQAFDSGLEVEDIYMPNFNYAGED